MMQMMMPGTQPFWVAGFVLVGLVGIEILALLVGFSASGFLDDGLGFDHHGHGDGHDGVLGSWMSWLNAGGVPLLVLMMIWLAAFAAAGFAIQGVVPLPTIVAAGLAFVAALPATRVLSRGVSAIIPRDETSVVSQAEFIGLLGVVTLGPLDQGMPGRVRIKDRHGNPHILRAKAAPGHSIEEGASVLVVDGANGLFEAIPAPADLATITPNNGG